MVKRRSDNGGKRVVDAPDGVFASGYGHFSKDGTEYMITRPRCNHVVMMVGWVDAADVNASAFFA